MAFTNITPKGAFEKMEKEGFCYLDVRTVEEFQQGHAKGSVNIPIFLKTPAGRQLNPEFIAAVQKKFPATAKLVIGCHSGGRSAKACELLEAQSYKNLFNIDGGFGGRPSPETGEQIKGWKDEGLPCE